jgi:CRP-like cAMP-binding protein
MKNNFELIIKNVSKQIELNDNELKLFCSKFQIENLKAKQVLVDIGEICTRTYFVNSGCLRSFALDSNGVEHTISFAPTDWWIAEMYSYISGEPATMKIEAIEASEILFIEKSDYENLFHEIPKLERVFRMLLERSVVAHQKRLIDNLSKSAEDRYINFTKKFPALVNTVPQKQIASYIGVTPEFFSKMKAKILRGK